MNSEQDLMQKLMVSKKIMDKHNDMGRGQTRNINTSSYDKPIVEDYSPVPASYNIPQEYLDKPQTPVSQPQLSGNLEERVSKSKLPDEIKKLMLEHPIQQPTMGMASNSVLSEELVAKASRLMGTDAKGDPFNEQQQRRQTKQSTSQSSNVNMDDIRQVVRETVEEVLSENGLLVESESKSTDMFKFRVGQHLFEGKVLKIKKMSK
jgi:hypothetical protein